MPPEISSSWGEFLFLYVALTGGAAYLAGQTLALEWRPAWAAALFSVPIAAAGRFLDYALFDGVLLSALGYGVVQIVCLIAALGAHRLNQAGLMVRQYPWLYERAGPFSWRPKGRPEG